MVFRVAIRITDLQCSVSRVHERVHDDPSADQLRELQLPVREDIGHWRIRICFLDLMNAMRSNVSYGENSITKNLMLQAEVPLLDIRSAVDVVVQPKGLCGLGRRDGGKDGGKGRVELDAGPERRIVVVLGGKVARTDDVMKNAEAAPQRGLVIAENVPGKADSGIEVMERRIGGIDVRHRHIAAKRRIDNGVQLIADLD